MTVYVLLEEYDCTSVMGVYSLRELAERQGERHPWNSPEGKVYRIVEAVLDAPAKFIKSHPSGREVLASLVPQKPECSE